MEVCVKKIEMRKEKNPLAVEAVVLFIYWEDPPLGPAPPPTPKQLQKFS